MKWSTEKIGTTSRRQKPYAPQGVTHNNAAYPDQEGQERRLVHITPGQMVAARQVIELIAEVTVAIVEDAMEYQLTKRNRDNNQHAPRKECARRAAGIG